MLSEVQLFAISLMASVIVWVLKLAKANTPSGWLTGGIYAVSLVLAFVFAPLTLPVFPPFGDIATFIPAVIAWIGDVLVPLSAFVGFGTLIYNALLKQVLDQYVKPLLKK